MAGYTERNPAYGRECTNLGYGHLYSFRKWAKNCVAFRSGIHPEFAPGSLPDRVIIVWKYDSETGQPAGDEHQRMNRLEDLLEPVTESGHFATLALISTGEGLREWTYYTKSGASFVERLNAALTGQPDFPIEIHEAHNPNWCLHAEFLAGVQAKAD